MGIAELSAWHRSQVGTMESGNNNVIYNTHYYGREVSGSEYPWCAAYIWDGFRECGMSDCYLGGMKSAYVPFIAGWARANNRFVTGQYQEGDLLIFDTNGDGITDHIGYCLSYDGETADSCEGNWGDRVQIVRRRLIYGGYRPDYGQASDNPAAPDVDGDSGTDDSPKALTPLRIMRRGTMGRDVKALQNILIYRGYELEDDGEFGEITRRCVLDFQRRSNLEADGEVGRLTMAALTAF